MEHSQESSDDDLYLFDDDDNVFLSAVAQQQCIFFVQAAERSADARLGGSTQGRLVNKDRNRVQGHERLMKDYFVENPIYNAVDFRRRRSTATLRESQTRPGRWASRCYRSAPRQCVSWPTASRQICLSDSTGRKGLRRFVAAIVQAFGEHYLRQPNAQDVQRLLAENGARGLPGKLDSLDCIHWFWKNAPLHGLASTLARNGSLRSSSKPSPRRTFTSGMPFLACWEYTMTLMFWIARRCSRIFAATERRQSILY
uniref:Uncharacterized protein n=1 Tax=Hyaloperonospora arabidopsidis (strain Emoy2) TaxID=559515 RepID=M4BDZ4_HYAAE